MTLAVIFDSIGFGEWFVKAVQEVEKQPEDAFTVDSAENDEPAAASADDGAPVPVDPPAAGMPPVEGA